MARTTRRQFFQTSAVVSGAFFIGGTKSSGDVIGANERVRLAAGAHDPFPADLERWDA